MNRPGDVAAAAVAYLSDVLAAEAVSVGADRPSDTDWQEPFRSVVRVALADRGRTRQLVLDDFTLTVEVWDADSVRCADLSSLVVGWLEVWTGVWAEVHIYQCETLGPREVPDPDVSASRYLVTALGTARRLDT